MANDMTIFAKLSSKIYLNVKVRKLAKKNPRAAFLWVLAIAYSVDCRTNGEVDDFALRSFLGGTPKDITILAEAGFIEETEKGWYIHDFSKSQVTVEQQDGLSQKRAEAGRRGGIRSGVVRADEANPKQNRSNLEANAEAKSKQLLQTGRSKIEANAKQNEADIDIDTDTDIDKDCCSTAYVSGVNDDGEQQQSDSTIPSDWMPGETDRDYAVSHGLDAVTEANGFRDYHLRRGDRSADWSAMWRGWVDRNPKAKRKQEAAKPSEADVGREAEKHNLDADQTWKYRRLRFQGFDEQSALKEARDG